MQAVDHIQQLLSDSHAATAFQSATHQVIVILLVDGTIIAIFHHGSQSPKSISDALVGSGFQELSGIAYGASLWPHHLVITAQHVFGQRIAFFGCHFYQINLFLSQPEQTRVDARDDQKDVSGNLVTQCRDIDGIKGLLDVF